MTLPRHERPRAWLRATAVGAISSGVVALALSVVPVGGSSFAAGHTRFHVPDRSTPTQNSAPAPAQADAVLGGAHLVAVSDSPVNVEDPSEVATAVVPTLDYYQSPGAQTPEGSLPNPNYLGAPLVLLVTADIDRWIQAYIPVRPNDTTAWFPAQDVTLSTVPCHIAVGIGAHKLVLYCNNTQVFEAPVATGAPGSPTPTGSFFVAYIVKLTDPGGPYGPYALGISAFSDTYYSFEGGPGQIGIHGTDQPWVIGSFASHGCVRLNNDDITTLAEQVAPGTPVEISP